MKKALQTLWNGIEVVITSTTGNRVAVMSGTRVRIPPTPPKMKSRDHSGLGTFFVFAGDSGLFKCVYFETPDPSLHMFSQI